MDKIIEIVITFYIISAVLRFLTGGRKKKERPYYPAPHPHPRPAPPSSRSAPPTFPDRRVPAQTPYNQQPPYNQKTKDVLPRQPVLFPKDRDRDPLDVLAEWERRARPQEGRATQQEGRATTREGRLTTPKAGPLPARVKVSTGEVSRALKGVPAEKISRSVEPVELLESKGILKPEEILKPAPSQYAGQEAWREETAKVEDLLLNHPSVLRQGIIMSEILRPPLARRRSFLLPYLRG